MSAELMKSKFVWRPSGVRSSVRPSVASIISEPIAFLKKMHFPIFYNFLFSFSLTWDPMRAQILNRHSTLKSLWIFSNFSEFSSQLSSQKVLFWIFKIFSLWFLTKFWNSPLYPMGKPKTPVIWKTSDRRGKTEWNLGLVVSIQDTFDS